MPEATEDTQYEDFLLTYVSPLVSGCGWEVKHSKGWCNIVPAESTTVPVEGMTMRLYGKGIGYPIRGMMLDSQVVFYHTEAEFQEKQENEIYGADCSEWLRRWDAGKSVWSVEMGGIGPGYEQAIQITAAEVLRHMIDNNAREIWDDKEKWKAFYAEMEKAMDRVEAVSKLGLSGAQWAAATNLAFVLYRKGPRGALTDSVISDRKILVSRKFSG